MSIVQRRLILQLILQLVKPAFIGLYGLKNEEPPSFIVFLLVIFLIFSAQNLLFANPSNRYEKAKKSPSPIVFYFYSKK